VGKETKQEYSNKIRKGSTRIVKPGMSPAVGEILGRGFEKLYRTRKKEEAIGLLLADDPVRMRGGEGRGKVIAKRAVKNVKPRSLPRVGRRMPRAVR